MKTYVVNKPVIAAVLHDALTAAGVPVVTVRQFGDVSGEVDTQDAAVDATVLTVIAAHDGSPAGEAARLNLSARVGAKLIITTLKTDLGKALRAEAGLIVDELNIIRRQIINVVNQTFDPPNIANNTGFTSPELDVPGVAFRDNVEVAAPYSLQGIMVTAYVSQAGKVQVRLHNSTGGAINLGSGSWKITVTRFEVMNPRDMDDAKTALQNRIDSGSVD